MHRRSTQYDERWPPSRLMPTPLSLFDCCCCRSLIVCRLRRSHWLFAATAAVLVNVPPPPPLSSFAATAAPLLSISACCHCRSHKCAAAITAFSSSWSWYRCQHSSSISSSCLAVKYLQACNRGVAHFSSTNRWCDHGRLFFDHQNLRINSWGWACARLKERWQYKTT